MPSPTADFYSVASGQPVYAGRSSGGRLSGAVTLDDAVAAGAFGVNASALSGAVTLGDAVAAGAFTGYLVPAWMAGKALNEWFSIAGTALSASRFDGVSARISDFSGAGIVEATSELIVAVSGGHGGSTWNSVNGIILTADIPAWVERNASTPAGQILTGDVYTRNADGKPSSRHTYFSTQHIPQSSGKLFVTGLSAFGGSGGPNYPTEAFDLNTNTWDAQFTWPGYDDICAVERATGAGWSISDTHSLKKRDPVTGVFTETMSTAAMNLPAITQTLCHDSARNHLFYMSAPSNGTVLAFKVTADGTVKTTINFNSSAALTDLLTTRTASAMLEYDPVGDRYFLIDNSLRVNTIFVITPNAGVTWDVSYFAFGGGSVSLPQSGNGVMNKIRYVPSLKGLVFLADGIGGVYFMRLS